MSGKSPGVRHLELMEVSKQLYLQVSQLADESKKLVYQSKALRYRGKFNVMWNCEIPNIKECSCGKKYRAGQWGQLPLVGYDTVGHLDAELRNCPCGSTLTIIIERRKRHDT